MEHKKEAVLFFPRIWLSRFSRRKRKLSKIFALLQLHDVTLIATEMNLRYQLYLYGLKGISVS